MATAGNDIVYRVQGGIALRGDVHVSGAKNAVLPLLAGTILAKGETTLRNVPDLQDVRVMLSILEYLGAQTSFHEGTVRVRTENVQSKPIPHDLVSKLRGSIVLLGPLLARFGVAEMFYPGGCVLGKRPVESHVLALTQLGARDMSTDQILHLQGQLKPGRIVMSEFSVTATENALMAAALLPGETRIEIAAAEPHVQDVAQFLVEMGATVEGVGSHTLTVHGKEHLQCTDHRVTTDYLEVGMFAVAALLTRGRIRIHGAIEWHLTSFLELLKRMGAVWTYDPKEQVLFVDGEISTLRHVKVETNIFPGVPTDLQATLGVLLSQATGVSRIFERLYEGRLAYLYELEKMGAHIEILNAHEALVIGPTPLRGRQVASNDIRAGGAMVLAGLCAEGETTVTDIRYIERGYEKIVEKFESLGARIVRSA